MTSKRDEIDIIKIATEQFPNTIMVDGYDKAIVGISIRKPNISNVIYSMNEIIMILMRRDSMEYDEAVSFFEYNIKPIEDVSEDKSPLFWDDRPHFSLN